MKCKQLAILLGLCLGITAATAHADEMISIKAGFMILAPSGSFGATVNNVGSNIDLEQDLNFDNSTQPVFEVGVNLGDSLFTIAYTPLNFSGQGNLNRNISYNGQNFTAGALVQSEFKANILDIGYTYYLLNMDDLPSRVQLGIESSVKVISAKTSMAAVAGGVQSAKNVTIPIPTVGLRGRVALADFIGLTGRIGYLGYSGNTYTDADVQIEFSPLPTLGIYAGYRFIKLKLDVSDVLTDTTFKGPYAGAFFRF